MGEALVAPAATKLSDPDGGPEYLQISAELLNRPRLVADVPATEDMSDSVNRWRALVDPFLGQDAARLHRRFTVIRFSAIELGRRAASAPHADNRLFVSQLVDLVVALLQAPVSAGTATLAAERDRGRHRAGSAVASTDQTILRRGRLADAADLLALVQAAYRGEGGRRGWTSEADLVRGRRTNRAELEHLLGADPAMEMMIVAERDGRPIGCCHLERESDTDAYFGLFAVEPELQGMGLGARILAQAEAQARAWGCGNMRIQVIGGRTELISWYQRRGYRPTGRTFPFPDHPDDRPVQAGLRFLEMRRDLGQGPSSGVPERQP